MALRIIAMLHLLICNMLRRQPAWYSAATNQTRLTFKKGTILPRFVVQGSWVTVPDRFLTDEPPCVKEARLVRST